jgi:DNA topoisomerase-1
VLEGTPYERPWKPGDTPSYFLPDKSVEAKKFDDLPGDTPVVLFHGTSKAGVNRLIAGGRGRVAVGDSISDLTQGDGLYVAPTTKDAAFYVPKDDGEVVAIMTLKKHVIASPEAKRKTPGQALYDSFEGAMLQPDAPFTARLIRAIEKAHDGDGDMRVHDGTDAERPKGPMDTPKLGGRRARQQGTRERIKSLRAKAAAGSGFRAATDEDRKRLAIPPAWTDVEVSEDPEGVNGLLARGRDAKGRRQGRYSAAHTEQQAAVKFNRVKRISPALPRFDRQLKKDALTDDSAGALTIIRRLGMRLGGEGETGAEVQAYGANTLERRHVKIEGRKVTFDFIGKKGVHITIVTSDPEVRRVVQSRLDRDGEDTDQLFPETSENKIRAYLRTHMPEDTLVKDLRTIRANELALDAISKRGRAATMAEYKKARLEVGEVVSSQLGNNRSEALKSYINPTVFLMLLPEGVDPQL